MIPTRWIIRIATGVINFIQWLGRRRERREMIVADAAPVDTGAAVVQSQWETKQIDLLRRVADDGPRLRPDGQDDAARTEFDERVELVQALQRRGLLHCATPIAELKRDAMYAEITDVVLTAEGRRVLERATASPPPTASAAEGP
jgi:hypothetical protein